MPEVLLGKHLPLDLAFHPTDPNFIAVCDINGYVRGFNTQQLEAPTYKQRHHKQSCRSIQFSADGKYLISASADMSIKIVDIDSGKVVQHIVKAHSSAINTLQTLDAKLFASGDDDGHVSVWDYRMKSSNAAVHQYHDNEDYISDLCYVATSKTLIAAGGDGYLSVFDIRKPTLLARSDNMETEILSLASVKNTRKIVCGFEDGVCGIFSFGDWGDTSDRFPGHKESVDAMCGVDEETVCTGSMDGGVRMVSVLPNKLLGTIGEHSGPVECVRSNCDSSMIASIGHDNTLKFWSLADEEDDEIRDEDVDNNSLESADSDDSADSDSPGRKRSQHKVPNQHSKKVKQTEQKNGRGAFFAGLENTDSD